MRGNALNHRFTPGEVRIDGVHVFINDLPVSLTPLTIPDKKEDVHQVGGTSPPPRRKPARHKPSSKGAAHAGSRAGSRLKAGAYGANGKVPWIGQAAANGCGRTSQAMLVNYWKPGTGADHKAFQDQCGLEGARSVAHLTGKPYVGRNLNSLDAVADSVAAGNPVMVYTSIYRKNPVSKHPGHIIVLTGFIPLPDKDGGGLFLANDPYARNGQDVDTVGHELLTKENLERLLHAQTAGVNSIYIPVPPPRPGKP